MKLNVLSIFAAVLLSSTSLTSLAQTDSQPPELATLLSAFSAQALPNGNVRLNWSLEKQSPLITKFRIYRGYEDVGQFAVVGEVPSHDATLTQDYSFNDTTARPGVTYYYKLASLGQRTESVFPVVISAMSRTVEQSSTIEEAPLLVLPGPRLALYVRYPGKVTMDVMSDPVRSLVSDTLRPGIYEFDVKASSNSPIKLRLEHENGYKAEVTWPAK
jgi:hypothetical protein